MQKQSNIIKLMFNEMAEEYDHLTDLWYQYTFEKIDTVLAKHFRCNTTQIKPVALDVACGTGFAVGSTWI